MLRDGKIVINLAAVTVPIKFLFLTISRATAWTVALTMVGALIMRVLGGFGYARRPLRFGASGEEYTYGSLTVREKPRWAARLLGFTKSRTVAYITDYYGYWFRNSGAIAPNSKQLQRMYDMIIIRRELKKGFVLDSKGREGTAEYIHAGSPKGAPCKPFKHSRNKEHFGGDSGVIKSNNGSYVTKEWLMGRLKEEAEKKDSLIKLDDGSYAQVKWLIASLVQQKQANRCLKEEIDSLNKPPLGAVPPACRGWLPATGGPPHQSFAPPPRND